ncbi:MAG: hypothetical protein H7X83_01105, partial [Verrucomicrobia bacterium]|nr:hypothetical protein [Deltaproteobacteria bacterium]
MKRMLVVLLAAAMSWGAVSVVTAQADEQAEKAHDVAKMVESNIGDAKMMPAPEVQLSRLTKGLLLTDKQQKQIRPILEDEYAKLKVIQKNEDQSPKQIQKQVEVLRSGTIAKLQTYLTPAQKVKHDMVSNEIKANKQKRMKENRKARIGTNA